MPLLRSIELPEQMEHAGESMWGLGIEELKFPPDFTMMFHSFIALPNLRVLDVGNTPTLNSCLYGLESLEEMTIPATLEIIDDSMQDMPSFRRLVIAQREKMLTINKSFYLTDNFRDIYVENETPFELKLTFPAPSWSDYDEKPFNERTVLHVPKGSREAYAAAPVWETFKEIVEYDKAGVEAAESDNRDVRVVADRAGVTVNGNPGIKVSIFTADGRTVYRGTTGEGILRIDLPVGLYIVHAGNSIVKLRI